MLHFSHAPHAALHCFCSFACVLCGNSACSPADNKICCCTDFFCPFPLLLDLLLPGFVANCQFTRFIAGLSLWQNSGYPALLIFFLHCRLWLYFAVFCKSSALLIAAVDLSPGLLELPVKPYSFGRVGIGSLFLNFLRCRSASI